MKIKSGFVLEKVGNGYLAVAVGERAKDFSGLVRMNETGAFFWNIMAEKDVSREELLAAVRGEYEVSEEEALADIDKFVENLRDGGILA